MAFAGGVAPFSWKGAQLMNRMVPLQLAVVTESVGPIHEEEPS